MALNEEVKVSIPEKGIVKVRSGERTYIYYTTAAYRNAKGKPTSTRVMIGKLDPKSGEMIPNRNYYEIYLKQPVSSVEMVQSNGIYIAVNGISEQLKLKKIIQQSFPEKWEQMLTVAQYMLSEGNVMYYLPDYLETHRSYCTELKSASVSKLFAGISREDMQIFFHMWMKERASKEFIAYDVTSISSYGKGMESLEWGYNRDKEKLPQINLAMYYGETSMLPLYYRMYPGSITDKAHLQYMVQDNELISGKKARFVMDRGFYSADNLRFLTEKGYRFLIALPNSLNFCEELIDRHRNELVNRSECRLGKGLPYGKSFEVNALGFRMKVHVYYDPEKAANESDALFELLDRQEKDLNLMKEPPDKKLRYDKYFYINRSKDGGLGFVRNHKAIDVALSRCGFFLIAETDFTKSTAEVLDIYRHRDVVEKGFDDLKNELDMRRLHCHGDDTAEGKAFIAFLALIIRSQMLNKLRPLMLQYGYPFKKLLIELDKIRILKPDSKAPRLLNPLSKLQRDIFLSLNFSFV